MWCKNSRTKTLNWTLQKWLGILTDPAVTQLRKWNLSHKRSLSLELLEDSPHLRVERCNTELRQLFAYLLHVRPTNLLSRLKLSRVELISSSLSPFHKSYYLNQKVYKFYKHQLSRVVLLLGTSMLYSLILSFKSSTKLVTAIFTNRTELKEHCKVSKQNTHTSKNILMKKSSVNISLHYKLNN